MDQTLFGLAEMGGIDLYEVIDAYYECRRRKRRTVNAMKFELNWEAEAVSLWEDINNGSYQPGRSIAFRCHEADETGDLCRRLPRPSGAPPHCQEDRTAA